MQLPTLKPVDKDAATKKAVEELAEVVRYTSQFKLEAIELLKKFRPKTTMNAMSASKVNYEDAMLQADDAFALEDWPKAIAYLRRAVSRLDPSKDSDKLNTTRYRLAFALFRAKRYAEADVLAEYIARSHPGFGLASQGSALGMISLVSAYTTGGLAPSDLERLLDLSAYTIKAFPDSEQADVARIYQGEIALGQGKFEDAAKAFEAVHPSRRNAPTLS